MYVRRIFKTALLVGAAVLVLLAGGRPAAAQTINFSLFSSSYTGSSNAFAGMAMDPTTGRYYVSPGYGPGFGGGTVRTYNNAADFASNTVSGTAGLQGSGIWGTYFTVNGGKVFGRSSNQFQSGWPVDAIASRWDAATGTLEATSGALPGVAGTNGTDTFDWGGFSGPSWFQDSTGMYVLGHNSGGGGYQVFRMGTDLSILDTRSFSTSETLGYGFMINGTLFTGDAFFDRGVQHRLDFATGAYSATSFTLGGALTGNPYLSNFTYDPNADRLYAWDTDTRRIYAADNASQQFGVASAAVPEPTSALLFLPGLAAFGLVRLRRKKGDAAT